MSNFDDVKPTGLHLDYADFRHGAGRSAPRPTGGLGQTVTSTLQTLATQRARGRASRNAFAAQAVPAAPPPAPPPAAPNPTVAAASPAPLDSATSAEEIAKRAWLAKLNNPIGTPASAPPPAASAASPGAQIQPNTAASYTVPQMGHRRQAACYASPNDPDVARLRSVSRRAAYADGVGTISDQARPDAKPADVFRHGRGSYTPVPLGGI